MANDAYNEFLSGNSLRNYPFREDVSLSDDGSTFDFPYQALQDFRGFTRQEPEDPEVPIQLAALIGPAGVSVGSLSPVLGSWTMYFRLGSKSQADGTAQYLAISVDTGAPQRHYTKNLDSEFGTAGTHLAASINLTVSEDFLDLMPGDSAASLSFSSAFIEPGLFPSLYKTEIERLVIEDSLDEDVDVTGDVVLRGGYNMDVKRQGNSILLSPERGAGKGVQDINEYLEWVGEGPGSDSSGSSSGGGIDFLREDCRGNLLTINGIQPDENYRFSIKGAGGITVREYPSQHLIVLDVDLPQPVAVCPPDVVVGGEESSSSTESNESSTGF